MSKYKGLFTFDEDNHRYVPIAQADGIIDTMDYKPAKPLIKDEKIRKAVRAWAYAESEDCYYGLDSKTIYNGSGDRIQFWSEPFKKLVKNEHYTIAELCGEEE